MQLLSTNNGLEKRIFPFPFAGPVKKHRPAIRACYRSFRRGYAPPPPPWLTVNPAGCSPVSAGVPAIRAR